MVINNLKDDQRYFQLQNNIKRRSHEDDFLGQGSRNVMNDSFMPLPLL